MNDIFNFQKLLERVELTILIIMAIFGTMPLFIVASILIASFLVIKVCLTTRYSIQLKCILSIGYLAVMTIQIIFIANVSINEHLLLRIITVK